MTGALLAATVVVPGSIATWVIPARNSAVWELIQSTT
jgi:hypothetical protein